MEATGEGFLDRMVYPFNLPVGPRMDRTYQAIFDAMSMADHVEPVRLWDSSLESSSDIG